MGEWGDAAKDVDSSGRCCLVTLIKGSSHLWVCRSHHRLEGTQTRATVVPEAGLEPARAFTQWILSPSRLPISTLRRGLNCKRPTRLGQRSTPRRFENSSVHKSAPTRAVRQFGREAKSSTSEGFRPTTTNEVAEPSAVVGWKSVAKAVRPSSCATRPTTGSRSKCRLEI